MMRKTVLITEDQSKQRQILGAIISSLGDEIEVKYAKNSASAYKILMETTVDVFLIDIILDTDAQGDTSGIRLAKEIRTIPKYQFTPIIFVTSLEDPEIYAYRELHCYGYIEKPFDKNNVRLLVKDALNFKTQSEEDSILYFRKSGIIHPIYCKDIEYMETLQHMMCIYRTNGDSLEIPYKTCVQVLEEADDPMLLQCSRSTIINKRYVSHVDTVNRFITMRSGVQVNIGVTYVKKIKKEFGV